MAMVGQIMADFNSNTTLVKVKCTDVPAGMCTLKKFKYNTC